MLFNLEKKVYGCGTKINFPPEGEKTFPEKTTARESFSGKFKVIRRPCCLRLKQNFPCGSSFPGP
jgi:hypothetical protein